MVKKKLSSQNIGKNLAAKRIKKGFTHEQLASELEVSTRVIYMWETGERIPSVDRLIQIAEILTTSIESILS